MQAAMNERLTQTDKGSPMGRLLREFWQPIALSEELNDPRPVRPVTVMGERLVLFRNEHGDLGLMDRHCAHRGVDLSYGRLENEGLRCPFHGWLYDTKGRCREIPTEPSTSTLCESIKLRHYPCTELNGVIFAWMGETQSPSLPGLDCLHAPQSHSFAFKGLMACNWLQALEVGIDPAHASYLHRYLTDDTTDDGYGQQFRDAVLGGDVPTTHILREYSRPDIQVQTTDYGQQLTALRFLDDGHVHVRVTHEVFPQTIVIPMSRDMTITQWHVPVNNEQCYWYAMFTSYGAPCDHATMREQRLALYELPDYRPRVGAHNHYGYDSQEQRTRTFTGMGDDINVHDQWAVESPGAIADRTKEHLVSSDLGIIENRRQLNKLLRAQEKTSTQSDKQMLFRRIQESATVADIIAIDTIAPRDQWEDHWRKMCSQRKHQASWFNTIENSTTTPRSNSAASRL